jgi:hypothetical protein
MADHRIGFPFVPVPEAALDAKRDGRLGRLDPDVLGIILRKRGLKHSCSGHHCLRRKIAARLGVHSDTIYRSLRRLSEQGFIERIDVACPDPDDPNNSTGFRVGFPWIERADSHTNHTTERCTNAALSAAQMQRPRAAPIQGTHGDLRESNERKKNDDNGCASAPRDRHDQPSLSSSFSRSPSQKPKDRKQAAAELGADQDEVNALAKEIASGFGWNTEDACARIAGERANGHSLAKIRYTWVEMTRQWDKIRRHDWGWMHKTLKATGPNGPLPPEKPKAARPAQTYHKAQPIKPLTADEQARMKAWRKAIDSGDPAELEAFAAAYPDEEPT